MGFLEPGTEVEKVDTPEEETPEVTPGVSGDGTETPSEDTQKPGEQVKEEPTVEGLSDEDFEKLAARLTSEKGPFHKNPAWTRILSARDTNATKAEARLKRLAMKDPQAALEALMDEGASEEEAQGMLDSLGVESQQQTTPKVSEEGFDEKEFYDFIQKNGFKIGDLSPEQVDYFKLQFKMFNTALSPMKEYISKQEEAKQKEQQAKIKAEYDKEMDDLASEVKDKYGLDFEKEVVPEMKRFLQDDVTFQGKPRTLFRIAMADRMEELGKRKAAIETARTNKEKEEINSETPDGAGGSQTPPAGVGKNWDTTWAYTKRKR